MSNSDSRLFYVINMVSTNVQCSVFLAGSTCPVIFHAARDQGGCSKAVVMPLGNVRRHIKEHFKKFRLTNTTFSYVSNGYET